MNRLYNCERTAAAGNRKIRQLNGGRRTQSTFCARATETTAMRADEDDHIYFVVRTFLITRLI